MGLKTSITLLVITLLFLCFFINNLYATDISEKFEKDILSNFFIDKTDNFQFLNNVWPIKNNLDDLSLKKNIKAEFVPGEIIVKFKNDILKNSEFNFLNNKLSLGIPSLDSINNEYRLLDVEEISNNYSPKILENVYKFSYPEDSDVSSIVKYYENDNNVEYAEPNYVYHLQSLQYYSRYLQQDQDDYNQHQYQQ